MKFPVVNFSKCAVLYSIVAFKTLTFHKVVSVATHWGVMASLVTLLLQIFSWFRRWNKFENRSVSDEVKTLTYEVKAYKKSVPGFVGHRN